MPQAKKLLLLPAEDFYESYGFFAESRQGRRELSSFLDKLTAGDIVYDIGGFRGAYAIASKLKLDRHVQVHVFEPVPRNSEAIRRICALNELTDVEIVPLAVGQGAAMAGKVHKGDGMLRLGDAAASEEMQFESISLDDYVAKGAPPPSVMKIDVDGYELQVLSGARHCLARHRPRLWLEVHPEFLAAQRRSHEEVLESLKQAGYDLIFFEDRELPTWKQAYHVWCVSRGVQAA
jgi:FkbM family methyltransferase